ncbi:hypothetical protein [Microbispora sp. NPDC046933]|uniref:hypothetical protein n=1 Tax=Microbispora sp. NPDC046933 TaxID=3155618 RepID=UPI0033C9A234
MKFMRAREVPGRVATGAYILHSGVEKWNGDDDQAAGIHGMAVGAFPFLKSVPPRRFLKLLSAAEIATGVALLTPFVPAAVAGAALTGFSGGLLALYLRTPALHQPRSIWPSPAGIGVSKDVWMLGVGLGLLADAATRRRDG